MACTISLPPGTHHLKFWVDNQMVTSPDLPTAVDFNNVLVNYIEINADDVPRSRRESNQTATQKATGYLAQPSTVSEDPEESISGAVTPGEETVGIDDIGLREMPIGDYRNIIPQYLLDIDHPEDDPKYRQAAEIIQDGNGPPSLPMFLNRSILNGNTPVKDDGSVLTLPNHTVLNHLMTSSVKNGVLATSVTTRYGRKVKSSPYYLDMFLYLFVVVCDDHLLQACSNIRRKTDEKMKTGMCLFIPLRTVLGENGCRTAGLRNLEWELQGWIVTSQENRKDRQAIELS